jgi:hypothetical protein
MLPANRQPRLDCCDSVTGDIGIRPLVAPGEANLKVVGQPDNAGYAFCRGLCLEFL